MVQIDLNLDNYTLINLEDYKLHFTKITAYNIGLFDFTSMRGKKRQQVNINQIFYTHPNCMNTYCEPDIILCVYTGINNTK